MSSIFWSRTWTDSGVAKRHYVIRSSSVSFRIAQLCLNDERVLVTRRADDPANANLSVPRHLDFGNLRHIGRKDELKGDAATETLRQRLSPASFFRSQLEDCLGAGGPVEQSSPIGDWILLCRYRQLVDEAFGHEDIVRGPDAAPEGGRNARRLHLHIFDVQVRKRVDQIDCALGGVGVETIPKEGRSPSREDRGTREAMVPSDRHSVRVETG